MPNLFFTGKISTRFVPQSDAAKSASLEAELANVQCSLKLADRFAVEFTESDLITGTYSLIKGADGVWEFDMDGTVKVPVTSKVTAAFESFQDPEQVRLQGLLIDDSMNVTVEGADWKGVPVGLAVSKTKPK